MGDVGHAPTGAWQYNAHQFKADSTAAELVIHHFWSQKMATSGNYINILKTAFKWRTNHRKFFII